MFNPHTKFEVSVMICYEDMKVNTKFKNCGRLGWLGPLKVIGNVTIR